MNTMFKRGQKVWSTIGAQGLKVGQVYTVTGVWLNYTPWGGFTTYQVFPDNGIWRHWRFTSEGAEFGVDAGSYEAAFAALVGNCDSEENAAQWFIAPESGGISVVNGHMVLKAVV